MFGSKNQFWGHNFLDGNYSAKLNNKTWLPDLIRGDGQSWPLPFS